MSDLASYIYKEWLGVGVLYCADAREIVPVLKSADSLVADPPYGINGSSGTTGIARARGNYDAVFEDTQEYVQSVCVPIVEMALALCGRGALTPGNRCAFLYPRSADFGCFWQPAAVGCGPWGFCCFQPIFFYGRDPLLGLGQGPSSITVTERAPDVDHPCPKPERAWTWLTNRASKNGETVLDPFLGSGTTAVACIRTGRRFIGIEIEEKYCKIAASRIDRELSQPRLPFVEPIRETQSELFSKDTP